MLTAGIPLSRRIQLLSHDDPDLVLPALTAVKNIAGGNEAQTNLLLTQYVLKPALTHQKQQNIHTEALTVTSNITVGTAEQIQHVLAADIIPFLLSGLRAETALGTSDYKIQREALRAISVAVENGSRQQIRVMVTGENRDMIPALGTMLDGPDAVTRVALKTLAAILQAGKSDAERWYGVNDYIAIMKDLGCLREIESLVGHEDDEVGGCLKSILIGYFNDKPRDAKENNAHKPQSNEIA